MSPALRRIAYLLTVAVLIPLHGCTREVCVPILEPSVVTRAGSARTYEVRGLAPSCVLGLGGDGVSERDLDIRIDTVEALVERVEGDHLTIALAERLAPGRYDLLVHARGRDLRAPGALLVIEGGVDAGLDTRPLDAPTGPLDADVAQPDGPPVDGPGTDADLGEAVPCAAHPNVVACWPLEVDGTDTGPNGHDLMSSLVSFPVGQGVHCGVASSLWCPGGPSLDSTDLSVVGWVRLDLVPTIGRMGILDREGIVGLFVDPGGLLACSMMRSTAPWARASAPLRAGTWYHVACVAEPSATVLYLDGVEVARAPVAGPRATARTDVHVGENGPRGDDQLLGHLCGLALYDAVLDPSAVLEDQRRGRP